MTKAKYEFNDRFQFKILSMLVLVPNFQLKYGTMILPEYFENSIHSALCTIVADFAKKYSGISPSRESLENQILEHCRKYKYDRTAPEYMQQMLQVGRAMYRCDISDKESVIDRAKDFARKRQLQVALLEITDMPGLNGSGEITNDDYEKICSLITKVRTVGEGVENLGTETFSIMPNLPKLLSDGSTYSMSRALKTPFHSLDNSRISKGLGPGECMYIIGSSGQGKSIIKNNIGLHAALQLAGQNRWVAHATLELSELDNHIRYAANILNITQEKIMSNPKRFKKRVNDLTIAASIHVKWFRPAFTTPNMIGNWLAQLSAEKGSAPGLLIVDYPDKLRPSQVKSFTGNLYQDGSTISDELIGICADYQMPGVMSSQLQRAMQYSDEATGADVATSMAKIYNADIVGVIQQGREDKIKGIGKIFWDKNRRGRDSFYTNFNIDYSKAHISENDRPAELAGGSIEDVQLEHDQVN